MAAYNMLSALGRIVRTGLLIALIGASFRISAAGQSNEPTGVWIGQYQTTRAFHGRLRIAVEQTADGWVISVMSANEHYPSEELETVNQFKVASDSLQWAMNWGPTEVTFLGEIRGDFVVGRLEGREGGQLHFIGVWTAVREAAGRERPRLDQRNE